MKVQKLKIGQKVVVTGLLSIDRGCIQVGDIGTIVDNTLNHMKAAFPERGLESYWVAHGQIRKYKEPKPLTLNVGAKVKIRNYKKYPELRTSKIRDYTHTMDMYIGKELSVTHVYPGGSVRLDNGYSYCTSTLKVVEHLKSFGIRVGSTVRIKSLIGRDAALGIIIIGAEYTITRIDSAGDYYITVGREERYMTPSQVELVRH